MLVSLVNRTARAVLTRNKQLIAGVKIQFGLIELILAQTMQ
jgi:hypothetical protein